MASSNNNSGIPVVVVGRRPPVQHSPPPPPPNNQQQPFFHATATGAEGGMPPPAVTSVSYATTNHHHHFYNNGGDGMTGMGSPTRTVPTAMNMLGGGSTTMMTVPQRGGLHSSASMMQHQNQRALLNQQVQAVQPAMFTKTLREVPRLETVENGGMARTLQQQPYGLASKLFAECFGTFFYVFMGSLAMVNTTAATTAGTNRSLNVALAQGFTTFVVVTALGPISGAHCNPAITLALALAGRFRPVLVVPYWLAQLAGGFLGAFLMSLVVSPTDQFNTKNGAILFATDITVAQACTMECLLTALLCVVWLSVNPPDGARYPDGTGLDGPGDEDPSKNHPSNNMLAPLAIGMTLLASVIAAGSESGASLNPARALGPGLAATLLFALAGYFSSSPSSSSSSTSSSNSTFSSASTSTTAQPTATTPSAGAALLNMVWNNQWIYVAGPFVGAAVAALLFRLVFAPRRERWLAAKKNK